MPQAPLKCKTAAFSVTVVPSSESCVRLFSAQDVLPSELLSRSASRGTRGPPRIGSTSVLGRLGCAACASAKVILRVTTGMASVGKLVPSGPNW